MADAAAAALDLFSSQASDYAVFRPQYPPALFAYLAGLCGDHACAWDAGTGNGQAAVALAAHFDALVATDLSAEQLARATPHPRVTYHQRVSEASGLESGSVDLVTVATAFHWFDRAQFLAEAARVLRPNGRGVLAFWSYDAVMDADGAPEVHHVVQHLYEDVLRGCWTQHRTPIPTYATVDLAPFRDVVDPPVPAFQTVMVWTLPQLLGYLGTWSAVQTYAREHGGASALDVVRPKLAAAWGADPGHARTLTWKLFLRVVRSP